LNLPRRYSALPMIALLLGLGFGKPTHAEVTDSVRVEQSVTKEAKPASQQDADPFTADKERRSSGAWIVFYALVFAASTGILLVSRN
jgi:hypothetical protein